MQQEAFHLSSFMRNNRGVAAFYFHSRAFFAWNAIETAATAATIPAGITFPVFRYLCPIPADIKPLVTVAKECP